MTRQEQVGKYKMVAKAMLAKANIVITPNEAENIEFCDYGLGEFDKIGTEILTYVNTSRVCAKEIILMPSQICPEHFHPQLGEYQGKEETFRCRWGEVYLYVTGESTLNPKGNVPQKQADYFTVWHEIVLTPGEQYVLKEKILHWFQAGPKGAIVSEFSTPSFDHLDVFTDPYIKRESLY